MISIKEVVEFLKGNAYVSGLREIEPEFWIFVHTATKTQIGIKGEEKIKIMSAFFYYEMSSPKSAITFLKAYIGFSEYEKENQETQTAKEA